jgi:hypothetical protein
VIRLRAERKAGQLRSKQKVNAVPRKVPCGYLSAKKLGISHKQDFANSDI